MFLTVGSLPEFIKGKCSHRRWNIFRHGRTAISSSSGSKKGKYLCRHVREILTPDFYCCSSSLPSPLPRRRDIFRHGQTASLIWLNEALTVQLAAGAWKTLTSTGLLPFPFPLLFLFSFFILKDKYVNIKKTKIKLLHYLIYLLSLLVLKF